MLLDDDSTEFFLDTLGVRSACAVGNCSEGFEGLGAG